MKPTETKIAEAMTTIRELCLSCSNCGECSIYSEDHTRCILRTTQPAEWKIKEPPKETWRAVE